MNGNEQLTQDRGEGAYMRLQSAVREREGVRGKMKIEISVK